jgi:membrane protein required for colicin V production
MNWLDILLIVILVISAFVGLKNGLIKSVLSLVALVLGIFLAGRFYVPLSKALTFIPQEKAAQIAAFIIIFLVVMIGGAVLGALLTRLFSAILLGWLNSLGGAVFGLLLASLFCGTVLAVWVKFFGEGGTITSSSIASLLVNSFPLVLALLPGEFGSIRQFFLK